VLGCTALGYYTGKTDGIQTGIDAYHETCYHVGGLVVAPDGTVVQCQRLTKLPPKELDKFFKT
jgi:hypothetical protein